MAKIGGNIRALRKERGMKQAELAELLHVTRQTVSNYENGKSEPDIDTLVRIAEVFETDVNSLVNGPTAPQGPQKADWKAVLPPAVSAAVIFLLGTQLTETATEWVKAGYNTNLSWVLVGAVFPAGYLLSGIAVMRLLEQFVQLPSPKPWYRPLRRVLMLLTALSLALYAPMGIWTLKELWSVRPQPLPYEWLYPTWHMALIAALRGYYNPLLTLAGAALAITKQKPTEAE